MKRKINHICFDLDGTLIDSYQTIFKTTIKTLEALNIKEPLVEIEFQKRIGHHFLDIFNELKIPVKDLEEFINIYKKNYFEFIGYSAFYPGVTETIKYLKKEGVKISLLTTKAQDQADKIIDHFELCSYFDFVLGRRNEIPIKPAAEPLLIICKALNVIPEETLMVGDSELDINCGKNAGANTCTVTYGYRSAEALKILHPDFIIDNLEALKPLIYHN